MKQIRDIKLYSVKDLNEALGVNERTIRDWFNKSRLKGQKIGAEWHITEEDLRRFFNAEEGGETIHKAKALRKKKTRKRKKVKR